MDALASNYLYKVHRNTQKRYCLNLTKQQLHKYKSQQKKFYISFDLSKFTTFDPEFLSMSNFEHRINASTI